MCNLEQNKHVIVLGLSNHVLSKSFQEGFYLQIFYDWKIWHDFWTVDLDSVSIKALQNIREAIFLNSSIIYIKILLNL